MDLYSDRGYQRRKTRTLYALRHAVEQVEKDQYFNAIRAMSEAISEGSLALQSIINKPDWVENRPGY